MRSPIMTVCSSVVVLVASLGSTGLSRAVEVEARTSLAPSVAISPMDAPRSAANATSLQPPGVDGIGQPLAIDALDGLRGGESTVGVEVNNRGVVGGNTADGVISGANVIGDGAFANVNGISTVIQNSGSNVLIQNGTAVNVQFLDPTP